MTSPSSYFTSMAKAPLPPSGHQGDQIYRGITYGNSDFSDRIARLEGYSQDVTKPIFMDYRVVLDNREMGLNWLVTSRWTGQEMLVDFGFRTGSGTDTIRVFTGVGREIEGVGQNLELSAEGKFASLSRKKVGTVNSPVTWDWAEWNPAVLVWYAITSYGVLDDTQSDANVDIDYNSWADISLGFDELGYKGQAAFEGVTVLEWLQEWADTFGVWAYESDGRIAFNLYRPVHPDSFESIVLDESHYAKLPEARLGDVSNTLRVFHGFDPVSKVWAGEATFVDSDSVGSYGPAERIYDNEMVWHSTSRSAAMFGQRKGNDLKGGILDFELTGELPLWPYQLGDNVMLECGSWDISSGPYQVAAWKHNPETRKAELTLQSVEQFGLWFFLDDATLGLLDQDYNPIY